MKNKKIETKQTKEKKKQKRCEEEEEKEEEANRNKGLRQIAHNKKKRIITERMRYRLFFHSFYIKNKISKNLSINYLQFCFNQKTFRRFSCVLFFLTPYNLEIF